MAGFDEILDSIGKYFGFTGLACYSLTFIAVSKCQKGFLHHDTSKTGEGFDTSRAFNIIIPLLLSNETEPELEVASDVDGMVGRLRYQYDFAVMVSEWARAIRTALLWYLRSSSACFRWGTKHYMQHRMFSTRTMCDWQPQFMSLIFYRYVTQRLRAFSYFFIASPLECRPIKIHHFVPIHTSHRIMSMP